MVDTARITPTAYVGSTWNFTGVSGIAALAEDDGSATVIYRGGTGADNPAATQNLEFAFTDLPIGATITNISLRFTSKADSLATGGLKYSLQSGAYTHPGLTIGTAFTQTVDQTYNPVHLLTASTYTVSLGVYPAAGLAGGNWVYITHIDCKLTYTVPNSAPSAPINLTPINNATVSGLTPTLSGSHVDSDGDDMTGVQIEVRNNTTDALMWASGTLVESGSTFSVGYAGSALVSGTAYKWRARTRDDGTDTFGTWSGYQVFTPRVNTNPTVSISSPTGGAIVGTITPVLVFTYSDADSDTQSSYQIQVRRVSDASIFWDSGTVISSNVSITYGGTTLVTGTTYEWRVRVTDSRGGQSSYTAWASFTPQTVPSAPTISSPSSSGTIATLTPTISGTYNQGGGGTESKFQYEIRQNSTTIYSSGDITGVIGTGQAYGTNNSSDTPATPPALSWGTTYQIRARSKDNAAAYSEWSAWQSFVTNSVPTTPTNLSPNGSVTGDTTPDLSWTHNDSDGDAQTAADVELRKVSDDSAVTGYDPKTLTQSTTTHTVTETLVASPATAYKWRVRTKATAGPGYGSWSDWVVFDVATTPIATLNEPDPGDVVTLPGLTIDWAMTGGSGTQQSFQVYIYDSDQTTILHDSGTTAGTDTTYVLPIDVLNNSGTYYAKVILIDTLAQEATSSLHAFTTSWIPPDTITGLIVTPVGSQDDS